MRKTETGALKKVRKSSWQVGYQNNSREQNTWKRGDESIARTGSEIQVSAVETLSYTDGHLVYFGEAAGRAPHLCTFCRNITQILTDGVQRREVLLWTQTVNWSLIFNTGSGPDELCLVPVFSSSSLHREDKEIPLFFFFFLVQWLFFVCLCLCLCVASCSC